MPNNISPHLDYIRVKSLHQDDSHSENQPQKVLCTPLFQGMSHSSMLETLTPFPGEDVSSMWTVFSNKVNAKYIMESQNNLAWKGPKKVIQSNLLLKAVPAMRSDKAA